MPFIPPTLPVSSDLVFIPSALFQVICDFQWGGITYPFRRSSASDFNQDWATCKAGFGDDLWSIPNSNNFFIGLENLHHLLKQATFELHIYMHPWKGASYDNFTIGPEPTSYAVTFDQFRTNGVDDGFSSSTPVLFSASGNDVNGCYSQRSMAGWYGSDCTGFSMFVTGSYYWPVSGQAEQIGGMEFNLLRMSPYYDD